MDTTPNIPPTWCQKFDETTEVILEKEDSTWKIWTTVIYDTYHDHNIFKFVVKQLTGPAKCATILICTANEQIRSRRSYVLYCSNFTKTAGEYRLSPRYDNGHQFVISVRLVINEPHRVKPAEKWTHNDWLVTIDTEIFAIHKSISETLMKEFTVGIHNQEVELIGVEYEDFITLIDHPETIDDDLTVEKARKFHLMQRKYGIKHNSAKIEKMMEVDFWSDCDFIKYHNVNKVMQAHEPAPEMIISKKYRMLSLPTKMTINAFGVKFDVYFYTQEYNGTSYVSIGVISDMRDIKSIRNRPIVNNDSNNDDDDNDDSDDEDVIIIDDKDKYWSKTMRLNIQLHHPKNPHLTKSALITRELHNYQRTAGCPTFMLSSELSDYRHKDGSYLVSITLSSTDNPTGPLYPGVKDIVLCSGDIRTNVSRDLLLHYCQSFRTSTNTGNLSVDNIPIDILLILLDMIYHRSSLQIVDNIQKILEVSKTFQCQHAHDLVDRVLASRYRNGQIRHTKKLRAIWDLPLLRDAERMSKKRYSRPSAVCGEPEAYPSKLPSGARIVRPLTVNRLLDIILPLKVFKNQNERSRLCEQFHSGNGLLKLRQYRMALCTLEGVPQELRVDLKEAYKKMQEANVRGQRYSATIGHGLETFERLLGDGGFQELKEKANKERKIVQEVRAECVTWQNPGMISRTRHPPTYVQMPRASSKVEEIMERNEEDCLEGRRKAAKMFVEKLRKEEGSGKEEKAKDRTIMEEIRNWTQYLGCRATMQF